jgi:hypothetical protein
MRDGFSPSAPRTLLEFAHRPLMKSATLQSLIVPFPYLGWRAVIAPFKGMEVCGEHRNHPSFKRSGIVD